MDVFGDREKKPIWISGGRRNIGDCTADDRFAAGRNLLIAVSGGAPGMVFHDPGGFWQRNRNCTGCADGTARNTGCDDFFFSQKATGYGYWMHAASLSMGGALGIAAGSMQIQAILRAQGRKPFVPNGADEILKVWNIKENRSHYAIRCQSGHPDRPVMWRTYFLVKGIPDEEMLLQELERRENMGECFGACG